MRLIIKAKYTRRWKGKDGKWNYEYGKPSGKTVTRLPDGSGVFVATIETKQTKKRKKKSWRTELSAKAKKKVAKLSSLGFKIQHIKEMITRGGLTNGEVDYAIKNPEIKKKQRQVLREYSLVKALVRLVIKAKRMPIGTISHGRKKIAEGKWVPVKKGRKVGSLASIYKALSVNRFVEERDKNVPKEFEAFVTKYTIKEYREKGVHSYLSPSGKSGYAVTRDGDLISVFSAPGAHEGKRMIPDAIANGAKTLDCLGPVLSGIYEKFGFKTSEVLGWNDKYAPPGWNYNAHNRPNVYMMRLAIQKSKSDDGQMTPEFTALCKRYIKHLFGNGG